MLLLTAIAYPVFATPTVGSVTDNLSSYTGATVPKYEKYELSFSISGVGTAFTDFNPFNPNLTSLGSQYYNKKGILVDGVLTAPNGTTITHPAFWYDTGVWKFRYAPTMAGTWKVKIKAQDSSGTAYSSERSFQVTDTTSNHGFVQIDSNDRRFFRFSDGTSFYPIGCDVSGYSGTSGAAWDVAFPKMKANGGNYTRMFFTSLNIEPYCVGTNKATPKALNTYDMARAAKLDYIIDVAKNNGVYIEFLMDDWTYLKDTSNQYISVSGREAPCSNVDGFFSSTTAQEIYKRKLRYFMARWGYSPNLMCLEFVNELGGATGPSPAWHKTMGNYVHSFSWQPHLASSSNGSGELRTGGGIPWDDPSMDYVNYHDYAKYTGSWTVKSSYSCETLGSTLQYPWVDAAVWADRIARIQMKRYKWSKPLSWTEYGLINRKPGDSGFPDWTTAYTADTNARHIKDCMWAGMLNGMSMTHWKLDYVVGKYGGGEKFWVFKPLANYLAGESFTGLTQETTYPVADPVNPSPKVTCSNSKVMVVSMHGANRAYLYVKNLTDTWFRIYYNGTSDHYADASKIPTPAAQAATIKVYGMTPGSYNVEKWSTTATNAATGLLSTTGITVGSDGVATVAVSGLGVDQGIKIKQVGGNNGGGGTPPGGGGTDPGDPGTVTGDYVVTSDSGLFTDGFYAEKPDGSEGVHLQYGASGGLKVVLGDLVDVSSSQLTSLNGEQIMGNAILQIVGMMDVPDPVTVTVAQLRDAQVDPGLLVTITGKVGYRKTDGTAFYLEDGSGVADAYHPGIRVLCKGFVDGHAIAMPATGTTVTVVGPYAHVSVEGKIVPCIRLRDPGDIQ